MNPLEWIETPQGDADAERTRRLLAPLYDESLPEVEVAPRSPMPSEPATSVDEFARVRDRLRQSLQAKPDGLAGSSELRASVLAHAARRLAPHREVTLTPLAREVWVRRDSTSAAMPWREELRISEPCAIAVPKGASAHALFPDRTELRLDGGTLLGLDVANPAEACFLARGRLFARVRPQGSGRFAVGSRRGRVAVVGTSFDMQVDSPDRVNLLVTEGTVEYRPVSAATDLPAQGPSLVRPRQQLVDRAGQVAMKRLSRAEVRRATSWAQASSRRVHRTATVALVLASIAALLYLSTFLSSYDAIRDVLRLQARSLAPPAHPLDRGAETWDFFFDRHGPIDPSPPVRWALSDLPVGAGYAFQECSQREDGRGNWADGRTVKYEVRVAARDESGTTLVRKTFTSYDPGPYSLDEGMLPKRALEGRSIEYEIEADGGVTEVRLADDGAWNGWLVRLAAETLATDPLRIMPSGLASQGKNWDRSIRGGFDGDGDGFFEFETSVRLEGRQQLDGRSLARFEARSTEHMGGIRYTEFGNASVVVDVAMFERNADLRTIYLVDPETSRLHAAACDIVSHPLNVSRVLRPRNGPEEVAPLVGRPLHFRFLLKATYLAPKA